MQKSELLWVQKREVEIVLWQVHQSRNHAEAGESKGVRRKRNGGARFLNWKSMGSARFLNRKRVGVHVFY